MGSWSKVGNNCEEGEKRSAKKVLGSRKGRGDKGVAGKRMDRHLLTKSVRQRGAGGPTQGTSVER